MKMFRTTTPAMVTTTTTMLVMMMMTMVLVVMEKAQPRKNNFLVSTGNKILSIEADGSKSLLYEDPRSIFISVVVDLHDDDVIFWSDMSYVRRGIYEARLWGYRRHGDGGVDDDDAGADSDLGDRLEIGGVEKLALNPAVDTVYCLAIDPMTNSLYWTDAVQKTVEVYSYKTGFRKIIIFEDLGSPRGITIDLFSGYLFWNDQDYKRIERSKFDGSDRKVIAEDTILPNHMACHNGRLYWTDSHNKVLESIDFHGNHRRVVRNFTRQVASGHIVGLAITSSYNRSHDDDDNDDHDDDGGDNDGKSDDEKDVERSNDVSRGRRTRESFIVTGFAGSAFIGAIDDDDDDDGGDGDDDDDDGAGDKENFEVVTLPNQKLYGAVTLRSYKDWRSLKNLSNPCLSQKCQQLCFPVDNEARCSCASYGGLTPRGTECIEPKEILLFTIGKGGFVAYVPDPDWLATNTTSFDVYFVAKGIRPTAVAYNPIKKVVYWSDVDVQRIMQTTFDGRETKVVLDVLREGGIVDGLAFDPASNLLFFTNIGVVGGVFTWRKVEVIDADDVGRRRTIISGGGMPRALAVDVINNYIYYSDWGETGSIRRSNMDGTEVKVIRSGLDNPNGMLLLHNSIYFVDSHYKNKDLEASLYRMNLNGSDLLKVEDVELQTPFGMTADIERNVIIISDWGMREIIVSKITPPSSSSSSSHFTHPYLRGPEYIMGLCFTIVQSLSEPTHQTNSSCHVTCAEGVCLEGGRVCLRSSYNVDLKNTSSFIAVTDLTGIKALNLDPESTDLFPHLFSIVRAPGVTSVAYHRRSKNFYFQDPLEKWIRVWSYGGSEKFFRVDQGVTSMLFVDDTLYWFDQRGHLSALTLTAGGSPGQQAVLVKGRVNPRGLREYLGDLYWIEGSGHLRLLKIQLKFYNEPGLNSPEQVLPECTGGRITWTSVFFLHGDYLYMTEGLKKNAKLFKCALDGSSIPELFTFLDHPQDLYIFDGHLLYTNFVDGTLNLTPLNHLGNGTTRTLVGGLSNPFHIIVQNEDQPKEKVCSPKDQAEQCLNGSCTPLMGRLISCECAPGLFYDQEKKMCLDESAPNLQCEYHNTTLDHGAVVEIDDCKSCRCFGKGETMGDSGELQGMVCRTTQCPTLDCEGRETKIKGQCCPLCGDLCKAPGFLDCPQKSIFYTLPNVHNYVIDKFRPRTSDYPGTFRNINLTRIPLSNIVQWNESNVGQVNRVTYVAMAFDAEGELVRSECNYTVQLRDETPPTITCPNDVTIVTFESQVHNVRWPIPVVDENSNHFNLRCSHNQGTTFDLGQHEVTYVVSDGAEFETECSFKVIIEKTEDNVTCNLKDVCPIKQVFNGRLNCSCPIGQLICHVTCDHGYVINNASSSNFSCDAEGHWLPDDVNDVELVTCVRMVPKTLTYSSKVTLKDACLGHPDPTFTQKLVEYQFSRESGKLLYSNNLSGSIQVEECTDEDMVMEFQLKKRAAAAGDDDDDELQTIEPIMKRVMDDIMEGLKRDSISFSILPSNSMATEDVFEFKLEGRKFKFSCERGEVPHGNTCIKCPPGTFWNVTLTNQSQCSPCPDMTFNLHEGMDHCTPCRRENTRHVGDTQCLVAAEATSVAKENSQHLIAALLCIVIVTLCLVAVAFFGVRHCRRTGTYALRKDQVQNRELYDYEESDIGTLSHRHIKEGEELLNNKSNNYNHHCDGDLNYGEGNSKPLIS